MNLTDLDPKLSDTGILRFDCPACRTHGIRIAIAPAVDQHGLSWQVTAGAYPHFTLHPSINAGCWHGHIIEGKMVTSP